MRISGAKAAVRALEDAGIELAFGIPGTHNIELYDALAESERVRAVLVTDEQSASFMADGAWRASGKMACVNIVPGAGLTHALSGIAEAFMDGVPMLVLGCGIRQDTGRAYQLHDVNQIAIARPVTKAQLRPEKGEEIYSTIREACRLAQEGSPTTRTRSTSCRAPSAEPRAPQLLRTSSRSFVENELSSTPASARAAPI
jgi:acetolactate synthase-1/2/3 large subunit